MRPFLLALFIAVASAAPSAAQQVERSWVQQADLFIVTYRPGPAWQAGAPISEQGLRPHGLFMRTLLEEGRLYGGGPFMSGEGGMMIVRAADMAEVEAMLAVDPALVDGIFVAQVEQWWPRFRADGALPAPVSPPPG